MAVSSAQEIKKALEVVAVQPAKGLNDVNLR
jgi:hypothetical protein